ncbi:hypothetical protein C8T65DRAFT_299820 [Cerioporus squamosus]|nr:hypothetical protein C8T65DRAFT_299820 [Cerioporus squamosus]
MPSVFGMRVAQRCLLSSQFLDTASADALGKCTYPGATGECKATMPGTSSHREHVPWHATDVVPADDDRLRDDAIRRPRYARRALCAFPMLAEVADTLQTYRRQRWMRGHIPSAGRCTCGRVKGRRRWADTRGWRV